MQVPSRGPAAGIDTALQRRIAKVFAAMQPKDAARVLSRMDDNDVHTVLAELSPKQQAAILGSLPAERAAALTRASLRKDGGQ